jgi:hypothetical protein
VLVSDTFNLSSSVGLQNDIEREELRVERALQEATRMRKADQVRSAAAEAAAGIDAFEMTLKRICGDEGSGSTGDSQNAVGAGLAGAPGAAEAQQGSSCSSPMDTLNRLKGLAPALDKLQQDSGSYLAAIKSQRKEDLLIRREREVGMGTEAALKAR